ncbi:MAG: hypothetical protein LBM08_04335 [Dysgonamonadaceae bacterium]|nr:hypothetical protein [Dysgonamonadaceae bacterium]
MEKVFLKMGLLCFPGRGSVSSIRISCAGFAQPVIEKWVTEAVKDSLRSASRAIFFVLLPEILC